MKNKIMKFEVTKTILAVLVFTHVRMVGSWSAGTIMLSGLRCENNNGRRGPTGQ